MGKKSTKKRTQWRTLSITEQDEINATTGTAYISNGNSTTGINIDEASSVDDNFKYSGTNFSYLKRKSSAFSPSSNNYFNNNNNINSNRNDHFRINSYNTNSSYYYNNKHNSSSINNNNNNNSNFIAINTTSNASSVNNDTSITTTLNSNNIRYTRSLSSSSRYSSSYNNNNSNKNNNNNNNNNSNNNRRKPYSMQNGGSLSSTKYYSSYGAGRATSRANRTSYSSYNRNNLNKTSSNNELSSSTSSSSTTANKENYTKPLFNEDEYTRITTPRQDVLFKKGYLSRPKPSYLSSTDTNTTSSATASIISEESGSTATSVPSSLSPEQCSSIHSDSIVDPEHAFMYSYIDQNGILYVNPFVSPNGFDHYPGQMFMMPYGYSPYNFGPPDLNTPSISDVDNETAEPEFPTENEQKTSDEVDENSKEENPVVTFENCNEAKENQSQPDKKSEMDTSENNDSNKDNDESNDGEPTDESSKEPQIDKKNQHNKYYHPHMRNNCDPNFFNYGYTGPPMYQPIFYPINFYGGQPLIPFIGPPPYETHPGVINEESVTTNTDGEPEAIINDAEKMECDSTIVPDIVEEKVNSIETEAVLENEKDQSDTSVQNKLKEENSNCGDVPVEIVMQIQDSNENVQSCDADEIKSSNIKETENKEQLNVKNLNVNVNEFVPRKPHLNVNVKEFQPRYLQQNDNDPLANTLSCPVNQNIEPTLAEKINSTPNKNKQKSKNLEIENVNVEIITEVKNLSVKDSIKINPIISKNTIEKMQESSQKAVPTLAEQIKKSLAVENQQSLANIKQQPKVFQNSNNKSINEVNNKIENRDTKSNFKVNKDKTSKLNNKSNNRNKSNRSYSNTNSNSDKNINNNKKNFSIVENIKKTKASNTVTEKDKVSEKSINENSTQSLSTTNVLSYAQMLNKDLKPAEEKATIKEITSTNTTNAAISTEESDLDDAEVQRLIKSLETAEKLTAMKENISWQTVKSRSKRHKHHKDYNGQLEKEFADIDFPEDEAMLIIEENTNVNYLEPPLQEVPDIKIIHNENAANVENNDDISQKMENVEATTVIETNSENKTSDKKKSKQKNKKAIKKSPNAKKTSIKDKIEGNSQSFTEVNENLNQNSKLKTELKKVEIDENIEVDQDIDNDTLALKLYEDLEKELDLKLKSNLEEEDDDDEINEKIIMGNSPDLIMKHSSLGRNLDTLNGFDYKYKTKNILKEEEEMVLNVIKSLSSNGSSPIGCNKKSDNIFNASFMALNGCNQSSVGNNSLANNNLGNIKTNLSEDPKNLIRKSSCLENTSISTQNCGKSDQEKNITPVDDVSDTVAETQQHEDSNGTNKATVTSQLIKPEKANSDYIQNCIKESLKWIKKMESVEKSIDDLDTVQSSISAKVINVKEDEKKLSSYLLKQNEIGESNKSNQKHSNEESRTENEIGIITEINNKKKPQKKIEMKLENHQTLHEVQNQLFPEEYEILDQKNKMEIGLFTVNQNEEKVKEISEISSPLTENETHKDLQYLEEKTEKLEEIKRQLAIPNEEIVVQNCDGLTENTLIICETIKNSPNEQHTNSEAETIAEKFPERSDNIIEDETIQNVIDSFSIEVQSSPQTEFENVQTISEKPFYTKEISNENIEDEIIQEYNGHQKNGVDSSSIAKEKISQAQFENYSDTESLQNHIRNCDNLLIEEQDKPDLLIEKVNEICERSSYVETVCDVQHDSVVDIENKCENVINHEAPNKLSEQTIQDFKSEKKLNGENEENDISNIETKLENIINGNNTTYEQTSNKLSKYNSQDFKSENKLLNKIQYTNKGLNCIKDIDQNLKDNLNEIDKNLNVCNHISCGIICNHVNGINLQNGCKNDKSTELYKNHIEEDSVLRTGELYNNIKEINQTEIPFYNNDGKIYRNRLSHSFSDSNDISINENGLEKYKSTSSLALQLQQLEEQLRKLDRIATPPLVCNEQINGYYHSETDLNSLESSDTNSSTLEDSLISPKNETYCSNTSCSSGIDFHDNNHNSSPIFNEPIINTKYTIDLDLNSSSSSNTNSKDCDSLNVTKTSDDKKCSKMFPCLSLTNENESSSQYAFNDPKKFPLTHAVKQWLNNETKEKTPEPILRLPDDPNLNIRIKSSLSLHLLNNEENYYHEEDCWSLTDNSSDEEYNDATEIEDDNENDNYDTENQNNIENKRKKSKNLKGNPLHVSSPKITNIINNNNQNDNDSDYNSDNPLSNIKIEIYDDNTCERVASSNKNNYIYKSNENISSTSSEQQIEYYWDDFIENPSKYLQQNPKRNAIYNVKKSNDNNSVKYRNTDNNVTILDTMESRFSSGNSSMNELNDLIGPYESIYGKSINYNKLLANHNELLSNNIINFNSNKNTKDEEGNVNDDDDDDNKKNYFNKKKFKENYSIAINYNNENDTSLNKNINLNEDNYNDNNNNNNNNNNSKDNCIKPPEVCCMLM